MNGLIQNRRTINKRPGRGGPRRQKVSIFDSKSRLVKTMYSAGKSYLIIRVSKLPAGIYFINLQNENKSYSEQFVITK